MNEMVALVGSVTFYLIPGYCIASVADLRPTSWACRLYYSFVLSSAFYIVLGPILVGFDAFTGINLLVLNACAIALTVAYYVAKKGMRPTMPNLSHVRVSVKPVPWVVFAVAVILAFLFQGNSALPVTWDRGKHFSAMIYLLYKHDLPHHHFGTSYLPFRPNGFTIAASVFTSFYAPLPPPTSHTAVDFSDTVQIGIPFNSFSGLIMGFYALAVYLVAEEFSRSGVRGATLSSLLFVFMLPHIVTAGSLPEVLGFCLAGFPLVWTKRLLHRPENFSRSVYLPFSLGLASIFLTYWHPVLFVAAATILMLILPRLRGRPSPRGWMRVVSAGAVSICLGLLLMEISNNLLSGTIDEVMRRSATVSSAVEGQLFTPFLAHLLSSLEQLWQITGVFLPFFLLGAAFEISSRGERSSDDFYRLSILASSVFLPLIPIPPRARESFFISYSFAIFSASGCSLISHWIDDRIRSLSVFGRRIRLSVLIISAFVGLGLLLSVQGTMVEKAARARVYINEDSTYMTEFIDNRTDPLAVILFPDSGPQAHLIAALSDRIILFADPRFPDIPSYVELSRIYEKYPTSEETFDYRNVTLDERLRIIRKYDLNVIVADSWRPVDAHALSSAFPHPEIVSFRGYTLLMWRRDLESIAD